MTGNRVLRVAAIGVGHLGRHHARILGSLEGAELVGVVDAKPDRAREIAASCGTRAVERAADLLGQVDAVSIAVPTEAHLQLAMPFLERGIPVLVEKPLARDVAEADRMIDAAARAGTILAVGHTERHNPAVALAAAHLADPRFVEVHRLGTFPERSLDIDVVFDLMIHDLDIVLSLVAAEVAAVEAVGVPVLTGRVDIANARLRFQNGCIANITASRISRERVRKIRFFQPEAYLSVDYAAQEVEMYRLVRGDGRPAIEGGKLEVQHEEPLRRELSDFLDAVRQRRPPLVSGSDGRRAIVLAQRIVERMAQGN